MARVDELDTSESFTDNVICCCSNGKIYASDADKIEVFDPVARRWELLSHNNHQNPQRRVERIMPLKNHLWLFCFDGYEYANRTIIFDPTARTWRLDESLSNSILSQEEVYKKDWYSPDADGKQKIWILRTTMYRNCICLF